MAVVYDNKDNPDVQNLTNVYTFISEMCKTDMLGEMPLNSYIDRISEEEPNHPAIKIFNIAGVEFKLYDLNNNVLGDYVTDKDGSIIIEKLVKGSYYLKETYAPEKYFLDNVKHEFNIEWGDKKTLIIDNTLIKGKLQITKRGLKDNQYSELKENSLLKGSVFIVYDESGNIVDRVTTNNNGFAETKELLKGKYTFKEIEPSIYYILNNSTFEFEIKEHKEIIEKEIYNDNVELGVKIFKKGFVETQSTDTLFYDFKGIENTSNVYLDEFTWRDTLPTDALRLEKIYTGTWNEDILYSVWYKTNRKEYVKLVDNLSSNVNNLVSFEEIQLENNEYVTEYEIRFGRVKPGFTEIESPTIYCKMLEGLGNGYVFTNYTKIIGKYFDKYLEDNDKWTTITYKKDIQIDKEELPNTGV